MIFMDFGFFGEKLVGLTRTGLVLFEYILLEKGAKEVLQE
jgi:hypothetical protein